MKIAKYQPGDRVRVSYNLEEHKIYYMEDGKGRDVVTPAMLTLVGKVVTIRSIFDRGRGYKIKEDTCNYTWTDGMFEGLSPDNGDNDAVPEAENLNLLYTWI